MMIKGPDMKYTGRQVAATCCSDNNSTGEFLVKSLLLQQNFVAATSCTKNSPLHSVCPLTVEFTTFRFVQVTIFNWFLKRIENISFWAIFREWVIGFVK